MTLRRKQAPIGHGGIALLLALQDGPLSTSALASVLGVGAAAVGSYARGLLWRGLIEKPRHGMYALAKQATGEE